MQLERFLEQTAQRCPDKLALVCGNRRLTYSEVETLANRLAHAMIARGIARGNRVAMYMENSVEVVVSLFAVLKAGAVAVMINPGTKTDKLALLLKDCEASAIVCDSARLSFVLDCRSAAPGLQVWSSITKAAGVESLESVLEGPGNCDAPAKHGIDMDLAALLYTSGSTGQPKAVMLTHRNLVSVTRSVAEYLALSESDVLLNVLPLSFGYGLSQLLPAFSVGATLVLERSFTYPHAVLTRMVEERVTGFALVPTICAILMQLDLSRYSLKALRYITNAAAALPVAHLRRLRETLPEVRVFCMYGQTECIRITYLEPEQVDARPGSVGRGMPNQEHYLVDEQGRPLPAGELGELVVRGSHVMAGYWKSPELTAEKLRPGTIPGERVMYTGDLFRTDTDGYLYFVSRKDDIIKSRGEKVSPKEVEEALYRLTDIAEAVVFGVPDPVLGTAVKAAVTLVPGSTLTAQHILRHCSQNLEDFMIPKHIEILEALPKTDTGKICRKEMAHA